MNIYCKVFISFSTLHYSCGENMLPFFVSDIWVFFQKFHFPFFAYKNISRIFREYLCRPSYGERLSGIYRGQTGLRWRGNPTSRSLWERKPINWKGYVQGGEPLKNENGLLSPYHKIELRWRSLQHLCLSSERRGSIFSFKNNLRQEGSLVIKLG